MAVKRADRGLWGARPQTARRDGPCGVTLAADSEIRHLSLRRSTALETRRGRAGAGAGRATISLSIALHAKWREGSVSSASINSPSQQPCRAAFAYNAYLCLSPSLPLSLLPSPPLVPIAPAALLAHFQCLAKEKREKKRHIELPHYVPPPIPSPARPTYVFTAWLLKTTSTGLKVVSPTNHT